MLLFYELLINFLKNNKKGLKEFYITDSSNSLYSTMVKFCPMLRKLFTGLVIDELETLKMVFNSCQYLESIKIQKMYSCAENI